MKIDGAIIKEQGIVFGVILVKKSAMINQSVADKTREAFQKALLEFSAIPLVLASQDSRGRFEYQGRTDLVNFLASISPSRVPWRTYTY